jgi:hypothetical protein
VFYLLWLRNEDALAALIKTPLPERPPGRRLTAYDRFAADAVELLVPLGEPGFDPAHIFAVGFQARRAFHHTFRKIFGSSLPAARLRATVWQSIFTPHPERYRNGLHDRMADIPTLITGESGTGKELVARAIALTVHTIRCRIADIPGRARRRLRAGESVGAEPDADRVGAVRPPPRRVYWRIRGSRRLVSALRTTRRRFLGRDRRARRRDPGQAVARAAEP